MTIDATFRRFHKQMCIYAYKFLKDSDEAQDVVQFVFIKFWEHQYEGGETEMGQLLYRMVRNACVDRLRVHPRQLRVTPIGHYDPTDEEYQNFAFLAEVESLLLADICEKVKTLPKKCRQVFELTYYLGKGTRQICEIMGISVQNVLNQKQNALKLLRIQLKI